MEHLIPEIWFADRPQWILLLVTAIGVATLIKGASWLVEGASGIAYRFGISKIIVGATIVSLGTTSPEAGVSVMAAWSGDAGLALGNAIGSVIADTALIFGLGCLIAKLPADAFILKRQGWVQFGSAVLLAVICYGAWWMQGDAAQIGRPIGALLLLLLVIYMWISVRWSRAHPMPQEPGLDPATAAHTPLAQLIGAVALGLVIVLLASRVMVLSVSELAENHWHVPQVVIAATVVALGTSLPEMVIGLTSVLKGHREILIGNVIGADVLNVLFVVGASAVAAPLPILDEGSPIMLWVHLPAMLLTLLLFRVFIVGACRTGSFQRWQGVPLILLYVAYTVIQFVVA